MSKELFDALHSNNQNAVKQFNFASLDHKEIFRALKESNEPLRTAILANPTLSKTQLEILLINAAASEELPLVKLIMMHKGANSVSEEAVNNAFLFACDSNKMLGTVEYFFKPEHGYKITPESVLKAYSFPNNEIREYLLLSQNPEQYLVHQGLLFAVQYNRFNLVDGLTSMTGANRAKPEVIDRAFKQAVEGCNFAATIKSFFGPKKPHVISTALIEACMKSTESDDVRRVLKTELDSRSAQSVNNARFFNHRNSSEKTEEHKPQYNPKQ